MHCEDTGLWLCGNFNRRSRLGRDTTVLASDFLLKFFLCMVAILHLQPEC